ncbi:GM23043 [Drosophila sechellia]|uniref:GM23043 n=1 Tax=Drosophila sechellia TaxID=7238 RepID=B4I696_DROSE|nr:GM23043 [Drosophila sechellia]
MNELSQNTCESMTDINSWNCFVKLYERNCKDDQKAWKPLEAPAHCSRGAAPVNFKWAVLTVGEAQSESESPEYR